MVIVVELLYSPAKKYDSRMIFACFGIHINFHTSQDLPCKRKGLYHWICGCSKMDPKAQSQLASKLLNGKLKKLSASSLWGGAAKRQPEKQEP